MPKLIKMIRAVPKGEIYPVEYPAGDECPVWLLPAAHDLDALEEPEGDASEKAELMAKLDADEIKYDKRWGLDKLRLALAEGKKD